MNTNKDISDLIKDNAHKLAQKPSKDAWARLEQRLDQDAAKPKFSIRRILSIAAAIASLLVVGAFIGFSLQQQQEPLADLSTVNTNHFIVEELEVEEAEKGFYKVVEFQKTYQDRLANPIVEGTGKKLSVAKFVEATASTTRANEARVESMKVDSIPKKEDKK